MGNRNSKKIIKTYDYYNNYIELLNYNNKETEETNKQNNKEIINILWKFNKLEYYKKDNEIYIRKEYINIESKELSSKILPFANILNNTDLINEVNKINNYIKNYGLENNKTNYNNYKLLLKIFIEDILKKDNINVITFFNYKTCNKYLSEMWFIYLFHIKYLLNDLININLDHITQIRLFIHTNTPFENVNEIHYNKSRNIILQDYLHNPILQKICFCSNNQVIYI